MTFPLHPDLAAVWSRRRWLQAAGAAAALGAAGPLAASAVAATAADLSGVTLRIGTYKGLWRPLIEASGQGKTPYRIDWRELNNGVLHIEAIQGDALDVGSGSEIPATFAARQKAQVRFIAVIHEDLNNQATLARKDAPIRSVADFKGKRVGYVRATTAHYYLSKQLADVGLSFSDIQPINLSPADGLSAFARGDLDAWAIYGYNGQLARTQYGARTIKTGKGYLSGDFPVYANPRAVDDPLRHAAITDFLLRLQRGYAWANDNYLDYAKAQSAETRVPVGDLIELFNGRSNDYGLGPVTNAVVRSHQEVADTFLKLGVLDGPTDVAPLWDRSFGPALSRGNPA
ncbi:ABC transporter substrate-binding protein [Variovorax sp. GT1P44]|uniref:ABC transporter substrate-binding protein n=1 Tax=Variovorax sp. GT1P44 TaxID=3443742 RepID=UPI003F481358